MICETLVKETMARSISEAPYKPFWERLEIDGQLVDGRVKTAKINDQQWITGDYEGLM